MSTNNNKKNINNKEEVIIEPKNINNNNNHSLLGVDQDFNIMNVYNVLNNMNTCIYKINQCSEGINTNKKHKQLSKKILNNST